MKSMGLQKSKFLNSLVNWEKRESATQAYMRSPDKATFKTPQLPLSNGTNLDVQPKANIQKIPILNLWMNWQNVCPNLSFTVEIWEGNLYKIRLLTFQT